MNKFENLGVKNTILTAIQKLGITEPTQIQELSIPHIIAGKDVIGESATGSGKTIAFACGIAEKVVPKAGLQALVLTPTRELAEQVKNSLRQLLNLNVTVVYGGVSMNPQIQGMQRSEVVVATPGRMLDHLRQRTVNLSKIGLIVLDEADRMLDMGFIDDVEEIVRACPRERQTLFFSATMPMHIKRLADRYMKNPVNVAAENLVDPSKLKQSYYDVPKNLKLSLLVHLLKNEQSGLVMVFCNTRRTTDFVLKNLRTNKISAIALHGGLSQNKRTNTLGMFNDAKVGVLICTDVAARGLHIENVSHVYNYEIPKDTKDYIHRIGRTARAGHEGKVVNLLCDYDHDNFSRIYSERLFNIEKLEQPQLERIMEVRRDNPYGNNSHGHFNRQRRGHFFGRRR